MRKQSSRLFLWVGTIQGELDTSMSRLSEAVHNTMTQFSTPRLLSEVIVRINGHHSCQQSMKTIRLGVSFNLGFLVVHRKDLILSESKKITVFSPTTRIFVLTQPSFLSTMSYQTTKLFAYSNARAFDDTKTQAPELMNGMTPYYDIECLPYLDTHPLHQGFDDFKSLSVQEIIDVTDDFLFGDDEEEELKLLMTAPILDESFAASVATLHPSSDFFSVTEQAIHTISPSPTPQEGCKKRRISDDDEGSVKRFRTYQSGNWSQRFEELCEYQQKHGDCLVSHTYAANLPLARWVKRQRYQYKLMEAGKPSTMIPERIRALADIGFCWGSQEAAWNERFDELKEFKARVGHCNVPSLFADNPQLATWVKCQRRQYKLFKNERKAANITSQRITKLEEIGFEWQLKSSKHSLS